MKRRRQDPVSCQLCRKKKLKCDRQSPCANCRSRQVECVSALNAEDEHVGDAVRQRRPHRQHHSPGAYHRVSSPEKSIVGCSNIRLDSEPFVVHSSTFDETTNDMLSNTNLGQAQLSKTAIWLENTANGHEVPENMGADGPLPGTHLEHLIEILFPINHAQRSQSPMSTLDLLAIVPSRAQALRLLDHYADKVAWIDHLLHTPTVRTHLMNAYAYADSSSDVQQNSGQLSLLCTVLGQSAYFWTPDLQMPEDDATKLASQLLHLAQRALLDANFSKRPTLETIQATALIMYYLLPNARGAVDYVSLLATAASWARKLGIHRVDSLKEKARREVEGCDYVELELKRRIWWFLASSDWIMSEMSGPSCGTYSLHPDHFQVEYPSNADDTSIDKNGAYSRPLSVPTETAFAVWRIRMCEMCRSITDAINKSGVVREDMDYETVLAINAKVNTAFAELPFFFRQDAESQQRAEFIRRDRPYIAWQAQIALMGINSRLSQLHRPYLARGYEDARYASSRSVCLKSARTVISVVQHMQNSSPDCSPKLLRMWTVLHHLFRSIVVLAMEYGFNGKDPYVKDEIIQACATLEQSQVDSIVARRGVKHLKEVLEGWKARREKPAGDVTALADAAAEPPAGASVVLTCDSFEPFNQQIEPDFSWFDFDTNLSVLEWDELLKVLELPPVVADAD